MLCCHHKTPSQNPKVSCVCEKTLGTNKQANKSIPNQTKPKHTKPYQTKTSKTKPKPTKHILFFLKGLVVYPSFFRKRHLGKVSALTQIDSIVLTILPLPRRFPNSICCWRLCSNPIPAAFSSGKKKLTPPKMNEFVP